MNESDFIRLQHMAEAARDAIVFVKGRSRTDLDTDRMLVLSLVKCIEIIGEAANSLSREAREKTHHVPWREIINMCHRY
jgi:uncharacterized protein with HEPN domain